MDKRERPQRTTAQEWRPDEAPVDSAPQWTPDAPSLEQWGVTREQARAMLHAQMCPVCGEGPWKSPLNHAARKHGIDQRTMRDVCGLIIGESVTDAALHAVFSARDTNINATNAAEVGKLRRGPREWTAAGRENTARNLIDWEARLPTEALAARSEAGKLGAAARWGKGGCDA